MWSHLKLIPGNAEPKRGRCTKCVSLPLTSTPEWGRSSDGSHSSSWETWSVVRGGALERICWELVERRHSHISHFALCLRAAESFRREVAVSRGHIRSGGRLRGGRGGGVCAFLPNMLNGSRQPGLVLKRFSRHEDPGQWTQARPIYQPGRWIHSQFSCFQKKSHYVQLLLCVLSVWLL